LTIVSWIHRLGEIDSTEMGRIFNIDVGLVMVVRPYFADSIRRQFASCSLETWQIGQIEARL
jgi:phosphoribosylformylglycinamidine cyclo-ligase